MLVQRIARIIEHNKLLSPDDSVIIGVSGGPDSLALLYLLPEILPSLHCIAVYVDHGLRPHETVAEIAAVRAATEQVGAVFQTKSVPVTDYASRHSCSLEEAARLLRYRALEKIRERYLAAAIAVAHTADDQVEEFFVRLCRGTGLTGLSGMRPRNGRIIRPLLAETKHDLLRFLEERGIPFCFDSSNADRRFLRNRVRLDLLPALENQYNPAIRQTILQTMDILREEDTLLETLTEEALTLLLPADKCAENEAVPPQIEIPIEDLTHKHPALLRRIIDKICWRMRCRPGFRQIDLIMQLIGKGENSGEIHLQEGLRVRRSARTMLFCYPMGQSRYRGSGRRPVFIDLPLPGPGCYNLPEIGMILAIHIESVDSPRQYGKKDTLYLDADKISFPLQLRSISPGQRFQPFGGQGRKKILRFLNGRKIAAHERDVYPVMLMGGQVVALPGLEIDQEFRLTPETQRVMVVTWRPISAEDPSAAAGL